MTNPEQLATPNQENADVTRLRELVTSWYPADTEFGYKTSEGLAMLTLDDILQICGSEIAKHPEENIKMWFDKYRSYAEKIHGKGEHWVDRTRSIGSTVLKRYE